LNVIANAADVPVPIPAAATLGVVLRVMDDADLPFAAAVYASTRQEEVSQAGWPQPMIDAFLAQQHAAQHAHYTAHYPGIQRYAIQRASADIGRLYLWEGASDLRIVDIALLPDARGGGIGAALLADVIAYARKRGLRTSIHVEQQNPARRLYLRMGFVFEKTANDVYDRLVCHPEPRAATAGGDQ